MQKKMIQDKEYEICKQACTEYGCYCPLSHIFHRQRADLPAWLRAYYMKKGYLKSKESEGGTYEN